MFGCYFMNIIMYIDVDLIFEGMVSYGYQLYLYVVCVMLVLLLLGLLYYCIYF